MNRQNTVFCRALRMHVIIRLSNHRMCNTKNSPAVKYGFQATMMCQCRFTSYNKYFNLIWIVDSEDAVWGGGKEYMGNLCAYYSILL